MELKEIFEFYEENLKVVLLITLLMTIIGGSLYYILPVKYKAVGSIFVSREIDAIRREEFTYEGFYAQQNASEYTKTLVGILESVEVRQKAIENLGIPVTENSLRKVKRSLKIKKAAPQVVSLEVKKSTPQEAEDLWNNVVQETLSASLIINDRGDTGITLTVLDNSPIVHEAFRELWFYTFIGFAFGFVIATFYSAFKEYLG